MYSSDDIERFDWKNLKIFSWPNDSRFGYSLLVRIIIIPTLRSSSFFVRNALIIILFWVFHFSVPIRLLNLRRICAIMLAFILLIECLLENSEFETILFRLSWHLPLAQPLEVTGFVVDEARKRKYQLRLFPLRIYVIIHHINHAYCTSRLLWTSIAVSWHLTVADNAQSMLYLIPVVLILKLWNLTIWLSNNWTSNAAECY